MKRADRESEHDVKRYVKYLFATFTFPHNTLCLPPPPPKKKCISIVFNFSWDIPSQEKLKKILMHTYAIFFFGGGGVRDSNCLMGKWSIRKFVKAAALAVNKFI